MRIRVLQSGEEVTVCEMVQRAFDRDVAGDLPPDGVSEFHRYAEPSALANRLRSDHVAWVAELENSIAGMVEIRGGRHISMLFVDLSARGRGIGSELIKRALRICAGKPFAAREVTVHAAPGAVTFYERMSFRRRGPERMINGIRFVPMSVIMSSEESRDTSRT